MGTQHAGQSVITMEEVLNLTLDSQVNMHDWFIGDVDPDPVFWGAV